MTRSRLAAGLLVILLMLGGCSFSVLPSAGSSATTNQVTFGAAQVDATIHALAQSGVGVYNTVNDASPIEKVATPRVPLQFLKWQARNLALDAFTPGAGLTGDDLDQLAPVPADAVPASYLVAAYVKTGSTAGGRYSQHLLGSHDWTHPATISFPILVLVLLLADAATAALPTGTPTPTGGAPAATAELTAFSVSALCNTLANWVDKAFDTLFNLIKVGPSTNPLLSFLGTLWNIGVSLVEQAVKAAIAAFTAPVQNLVRTILGAISVAAQAISFLRNLSLKLGADPPFNRYSGQAGSLTAVLGNPDGADWPSELSSCLTSFGFDLKSLNARNHDQVIWDTVATPSSAATVESQDTHLDDRNSAQLKYLTGQETGSSCGTKADFLKVIATVRREDVNVLRKLLIDWFDGQLDTLPDLVKIIVGPTLHKLVGDIIDSLLKLVDPTAVRYVRIEHQVCPSPSASGAPRGGFDACTLVTRAEAEAVLGAPDPNPGPVATATALGAPGLVEGSTCDHHTVKGLNTHATPHGDMEVVVGRFADVNSATAGAAQLVSNLASALPALTPQPVSGVGDSATLATGQLPDLKGGGPAVTIIVRKGAVVLWISVGLTDKGQEGILPLEMKNLALTALSRIH